LGITHFDWQKDRIGTPFAASGLRLEPRDLAKIGLLMLHRGKVGRRQVVPASWVKLSTKPHAQVQPDPECGTRYGYFWWLGPGCAGAAKTPWFAGIGNGGQRIWVVPSLDLVIVSTAGLYDKPAQGKTATAIYRGVLDAIPKGAP
jgi:CubicO group peptidase (beta-lactamase class C family)